MSSGSVRVTGYKRKAYTQPSHKVSAHQVHGYTRHPPKKGK